MRSMTPSWEATSSRSRTISTRAGPSLSSSSASKIDALATSSTRFCTSLVFANAGRSPCNCSHISTTSSRSARYRASARQTSLTTRLHPPGRSSSSSASACDQRCPESSRISNSTTRFSSQSRCFSASHLPRCSPSSCRACAAPASRSRSCSFSCWTRVNIPCWRCTFSSTEASRLCRCGGGSAATSSMGRALGSVEVRTARNSMTTDPSKPLLVSRL
mmetsp:Transcript_123874/g.284120  ORF Transcript_123874/g.284120 Transcript_123874/m.284120 type:complete len:218 (+) Transcript_123874:874-1527(+)